MGADDGSQYYWIYGVLLSLGGCTLSNFGVNMQKLSHMRLATLKDPKLTVYTQPTWVIGLVLVVVGSLMDLVSFAYADISLLAPLGAMTLVINMLVAPCFLHEKLTRRDIVLTIVILLGTVLSIAFGSKSASTYSLDELEDLYGQPAFIVFACLESCALLGIAIQLRLISRRAMIGHPRPLDARMEQFAWPYLAGTFGAHSVLFAKSAAEVVKETAKGNNQFIYALSYFFVILMLLCVVIQVKFLNVGLSKADALFVVPVYQCCWVIMNTIVGMMYFQDYHQMDGGSLAGFFIGVLITIGGVYLLSKRKSTATNQPADGTGAGDIESADDIPSGMRTPSALGRSKGALGHIPAFGLLDFAHVSEDNKREISRISVDGGRTNGHTLSGSPDDEPGLELTPNPARGMSTTGLVCGCSAALHDPNTNELCVCTEGCGHDKQSYGNDLPAAPIAVVTAREAEQAAADSAAAAAAAVAASGGVASSSSSANVSANPSPLLAPQLSATLPAPTPSLSASTTAVGAAAAAVTVARAVGAAAPFASPRNTNAHLSAAPTATAMGANVTTAAAPAHAAAELSQGAVSPATALSILSGGGTQNDAEVADAEGAATHPPEAADENSAANELNADPNADGNAER